MEFANVELQPDDGEHEDGKEKEQANLQQRNHGFHNGFQHNLQAWRTQQLEFMYFEFKSSHIAFVFKQTNERKETPEAKKDIFLRTEAGTTQMNIFKGKKK